MKNFIKKRIFDPLKYSLAGLKATWNTEQAFRIEFWLSIVFGLIIIFSKISITKKILLTNSIFLILIIELLNTGLEKTIDKISTEKHPISKIVKDVGSAGVFLSVVNFLITWMGVFLF